MSIDKETVVYANLPATKFRWISYVTLAQVGFIALNLFLMPTKRLIRERQEALANKTKEEGQDSLSSDDSKPKNEPKLDTDTDSTTLLQKLKNMNYAELFSISNVKENFQDRPLVCLGIIGAASLISTGYFFYAIRTVHMVTLLPGERVRFAFFSPVFSRPSTLELPLRDVSCVQGRKSNSNYSILKLRNFRGYHLVHKTEGQFVDPKAYDKYLGYQRAWAETK